MSFEPERNSIRYPLALFAGAHTNSGMAGSVGATVVGRCFETGLAAAGLGADVCLFAAGFAL